MAYIVMAEAAWHSRQVSRLQEPPDCRLGPSLSSTDGGPLSSTDGGPLSSTDGGLLSSTDGGPLSSTDGGLIGPVLRSTDGGGALSLTAVGGGAVVASPDRQLSFFFLPLNIFFPLGVRRRHAPKAVENRSGEVLKIGPTSGRSSVREARWTGSSAWR